MKAVLKPAGSGTIIRLTPESAEDQADLKALAVATMARPQIFGCRGFKYLEPEVEFFVQPPGRTD